MLKKEEIARFLLKEQVYLTAYISAFTRDYQIAEDIFQDICVKAISMSETFVDFKHLIRWSKVSSQNRAIDLLRKKNQHAILLNEKLIDLFVQEWPNHKDTHSARILEALSVCMELLTPNSLEILRLRYFHSLSGIEVAKQMKRKVESVYQALSRIHRRLEECIRIRLSREYK